MAEAPKPDGSTPAAAAGPAPKAAERNPAFKMMGLPNLKWKLPSRNWMIFLTVTGTWTAAVMYDRREKKKAQKKWCDLVAHIAQQPLPTNQMARRITVFISAPPGDGIRTSRDFFKQYVKPVLVAAAMDYDVIEGRKEGDVRYGTAEQIRRIRRKSGEANDKEEDTDGVKLVEGIRENLNITNEPGPRGDLVLGRHTWKEYVRGVHEGWLGPINEPAEQPSLSADLPLVHNIGEVANGQPSVVEPISSRKQDDGQPTLVEPIPSEQSGEEKSTEEKAAEEKPEEKKKSYPPPSYLPTSFYHSATLAAATPATFEPSQPIHQYHLLGFLRTPIRMWNFLNQRTLADRIGRDTAAIVLAASRPYDRVSNSAVFTPSDACSHPQSIGTEIPPAPSQTSEQASALIEDEATWHKSVRKPPKEGDDSEQIWNADMVLDDRIASRMRRFELDLDEAARAERIGSGQEKGRAHEVMDLRKEKVKLGSIEDD
jgi:mitochondrial import inner membrane translocase subunit TIM54